MPLKIPKLGRAFKLGEGRVGNRGLAYQLKRVATTGKDSDYHYKNLSKENIATITEKLKPFETALKKRGGLSRQEAIKAKSLLKKEYDKERAGIGSFTKEDYQDASAIVEQLKKSNQNKPSTTQKAEETPAKSFMRRPGIYNPSRMNTPNVPEYTSPPNTYGSIRQMLKMKKTGQNPLGPTPPPPRPNIRLPF